ncbi:putative octanoyltransferase [Smittium mucronatum]|uniref:lipoyl(octanoyl) transferase n=1 Tax=Smittium mucronatum TaxID=133383 RepID=A0A1R0GMX2_9FUNG|nr:putative octanoyltransferase [Smittium mucronatum]
MDKLVSLTIDSRKHGLNGSSNAKGLEYRKERFFDADENVGVLLLLEPESVYTNGRRNIGKVTEKEKKAFLDAGSKYYEIKRGGEITYHGPGQLVAYPILDLKKLGLGVRDFVNALETGVSDTCHSFGIDTCTYGEFPGVWASETRKIAATGTHIQKYVTSHGIALNCTTDLQRFDSIVPCGLHGKTATSLYSECLIKRDKFNKDLLDPINVSKTLLPCLSATFNAQIVPLNSLSPSLDSFINNFINTLN